jgi:outer membrane protein assembly factor BamD (BamD/ComL family)
MRESLAHAQKLFARKDYDASLTEYRRVLSLAGGRAPADAAFFNIGLIHADPDNPKRDVQQAVRSFKAVIAGFPQSPMADHARIWVAVLDDSDRAKQELETSKQVIERSKLEVERSRQLAEKAKQDAELSRQETEKTREVIEKSKRVDFEIEQKRRERVR